MHFIYAVLLTFAAAIPCTVVCLPFGESLTRLEGFAEKGLVHVGSVDGKSYFADITLRTWFDSRDFCKSQGLQLATITSANQWDFLVSAYPTFYSDHWVAARDSLEGRQFTWDNSGSPMSSSIGMIWAENHVGTNYQTCASFSFRQPGQWNLGMHIAVCSTMSSCLCETT